MDQGTQTLNRLISLAFLSVLVLGCGTGGEDRVVQKLDRNRGIENFVVGDSLYPFLRRQIEREDGTVEYSVLSSVITPYRRIEPPQRFLFGLEVQNMRARANGGRVSAIRLFSPWRGRRPKVHQKVLDSLLARYGEPTVVMDTSGALSLELERKIRRWKGKSVWMQVTQLQNRNGNSEGVGVNLRVLNQDVLQETRSLKSSIDSLLRRRGNTTIDKIGDFPLLSTSGHRMVKTVERDSTYEDQVLPYKYVEPFFGLPNPMRPYQEGRVITADLSYDEETDSLSSLDISIRGEKHDPEGLGALERSTYEGAEKAREIMQDQLGEPHLVVRERRIPSGENEIVEDKIRYWYRPPFMIEEEPANSIGSIYGEGVSISFSRVEEAPSEEIVIDLFPEELLHYEWK